MANTALNVVETDFDTIKQEFRVFLQSQDQFKDFDFEGSNISVLIDLLAYNTHQMAFYTNMSLSEMFLDSALLRDSIVSHAKELNYVPRSRRSASAFVSITVDTGGSPPDAVVIPKGTEFRTLVNGKSFTFTTSAAVTTVDNGDGTFTASNTEIFEGKFVLDLFTVDTSIEDQQFVLENKAIDTSALSVNISTSNVDSSNTDWQQATSLLGLTSTSEVFFVQGFEDDRYELIFGDNVASKAVDNLNVIRAEYRISSTNESGGANTFKSAGSIQGFANVTVVTDSVASGGSERESIASIQLNAPRFFQTRERAVTESDYKVLLQQEFPEIEALSVFGGEELNPPKFGQVAISIDLADATGVSNAKKAEIASFLAVRAPVSITPIIIDPEFLFLEITSEVKYDINSTALTPTDIESAVVTALTTYNSSDLNNFEITMKYSRLVNVIDDADVSIVSNDTDVRGFVLLSPTDLTVTLTRTIEYENPFAQGIAIEADSDYTKYKPAIRSSTFVRNGSSVFLEDNGNGTLQTVQQDTAGDRQIVVGNQGTVDYSTGSVTISALTIDSFTGTGIRLFARFEDKDIIAKTNKIVTIESDATTITINPVRE